MSVQISAQVPAFSSFMYIGSIKVGDDGKYCPNITIVKKNCKDEECNPTTGEFMNYAIIAGVASVALVSIALISKKKKFYTV